MRLNPSRVIPKKAKDTDSLGKLFAAYLRRAEESVLGSVLVETTILYMSTRHNPAQVLNEAATLYKVDTDIFLKSLDSVESDGVLTHHSDIRYVA